MKFYLMKKHVVLKCFNIWNNTSEKMSWHRAFNITPIRVINKFQFCFKMCRIFREYYATYVAYTWRHMWRSRRFNQKLRRKIRKLRIEDLNCSRSFLLFVTTDMTSNCCCWIVLFKPLYFYYVSIIQRLCKLVLAKISQRGNC